MEVSELLTLFRYETNDVERPFVWPDALVYDYIDDAQKQFCRDTYGISDSTSFTLDISPNTEWYGVDEKILEIRSAIINGVGSTIPIVSAEQIDDKGIVFNGSKGRVQALIYGLDEGLLKAWPIPNETMVVNLLTTRLPSDVVSSFDSLEIKPRYHKLLLHWIKYRAYGVDDEVALNKTLSEKHFDLHNSSCLSARIEKKRSHRPVCVVAMNW